MFNKRFSILLAVVLISSMLLAACATPAPEIVEVTKIVEKEGETVIEQVVVTATPEPATLEPEKEKELLILAEDIPACLNFDGFCSAIPTSQTGWAQLYDSLVYYEFPEDNVSEDGVRLPDLSSFVGHLAESWEVSEDGTTWTFHLRKGVISAAGNELTADDIVWAFARFKWGGGQTVTSWFLANVASILPVDAILEGATEEDRTLQDEVVAIDDYTLQIKQFEPNPLLLPTLTVLGYYGFDSEACMEHATEEDPYAYEYTISGGACGFGPYQIVNWQKDQEFVVEANPNYYRQPAIKKITYRKVPESANRFAALLTGDADIVEHLTPKEFNLLRGKEGVKVQGLYGNENLFLLLNFDTPPWDNIALRRAIAYALPYEDIIQTAYYGEAKRWYSMVPPGYPDQIDTPMYETDLEKAAELLAEAGFPEGQGLEQYRDEMQLTYPTEKSSVLEPVAILIKSQLEKIGIPVQLNPIPTSQYADRMIVKGDLPFALNDQEKPIVVSTVYALLLFYVSEAEGGLYNLTNYVNETVDDLYFAARSELDEATRAEDMAEAQEIMMDELAWVPVVLWKTQLAMRDNVTGFAWHPDNSLRWENFDIK